MTANGFDSGERVFVREGFAWNAQAAYLFDIDGTLLRSRDRIHYESFSHAVEQVLGRPLELAGVVLHGNTDPAILREAFERAGVADAVWRGREQEIGARMSEYVLRRRAEMDLRVMPGVEAMLGYLRGRGAVLAVATGNLREIGWLKVEVAGLREWFDFGGFSDGFERRAEMIAHALRLARQVAGQDASVCVVGDTPFDVSAARANGLPVIVVATGNYSFDRLMEDEPEACATTLQALLEDVRAAAADRAVPAGAD